MTTDLDTEFLGLWLDEELLRKEFDAIIEASWPSLRGQPVRQWPLRRGFVIGDRQDHQIRSDVDGTQVGWPPTGRPAPAPPTQERGPPGCLRPICRVDARTTRRFF